LIQSQPAFESIPTFQRPFLVVFPSLQIQNRPLPNHFPLSTKTTAGDFGQKVGFHKVFHKAVKKKKYEKSEFFWKKSRIFAYLVCFT
jgi:hypothetical protein